MDLTTLIGIIAGMALILQGIGFDKLDRFYDLPSIIIVAGGTLASVIACYPLRMLKNIPKHMLILMGGKKFNIPKVIDSLVDMSQLARKNGLLALEDRAGEEKDDFLRQGIMLIVDATDPDKVKDILERQVEDMAQRHDDEATIYDKGAAFAPAFGMIGTLVGLINMLKELDMESGGSSNIGPNMSTALVTTFYGCIIANCFLMPIAKKLRIRNDEEVLYREIVIEGILAIQAGDNPQFLKERLVSHMTQKQQKKLLKPKGEGEEPKAEKK